MTVSGERPFLVAGGGIGGLAAALALAREGATVVVLEKAPALGEIGAGLSLWSNAVIALRRLGVEAAALAAGSVIRRSRTVLAGGKPVAEFDFAALGIRAGAPSICIHRAALQRILADAVRANDPDALRTGRECVDFADDAGGVDARFADGSGERGGFLVGADGIHSAIRERLFGHEQLRFAGYLAWRGIARGRGNLLPPGEPLVVMGRGAHAGCFHCGEGDIYWFLARNAAPGTQPGPRGNRAEVLDVVADWRVPFRNFVEATPEAAILRNDVVDRPPRQVWGVGHVTMVGDAIHGTTPNLGQGACQALEDAVVLADALRRAASVEAGLRDYEARRRERANFVIAQSWRFGNLVQMANPVGIWLRDRPAPTSLARNNTGRLFTRLLCHDLPELA